MRVSLCLLTLNELTGCQQDVPRLRRDRFCEVFVVDGGSTDGTVEYLEGEGLPVYSQDAPSYNGAYRTAFRRAAGDALVVFHPKGTIDPDETLRFAAYFEQGYDLVVASRVLPGSVNEEDGSLLRPRKWFVLALAAASQLAWRRRGDRVWDVLHGFRGFSRRALDRIDLRATGVSADLEQVARAYRMGLRCAEFPVAELPRPDGDTHFPAWRTGRRLLSYLLDELRRPAPAPRTAPDAGEARP